MYQSMATMTMTIFYPFLWFAGWEEFVISNLFSFFRHVAIIILHTSNSTTKNSDPFLLLFLRSIPAQQPYIYTICRFNLTRFMKRQMRQLKNNCQLPDSRQLKIARVKKRLTNTPDLLFNVYHQANRITSRLNSTDSESHSASHQTHKMHLTTQQSQQVFRGMST